MARISTYQHDAMPHLEDNVIGTNQSPGHANETVLFSLQAIQDLILNNTLHVQNFTRRDYDNDFYNDLNNLVSPTGTPIDLTNTQSVPLPSVTINHSLGTQVPAVILRLQIQPITINTSGVPELGDLVDLGQLPADNSDYPYTINYTSSTQLQIVFNFRAVYSGTIILLG